MVNVSPEIIGRDFNNLTKHLDEESLSSRGQSNNTIILSDSMSIIDWMMIIYYITVLSIIIVILFI
jgi:hypothetical protein